MRDHRTRENKLHARAMRNIGARLLSLLMLLWLAIGLLAAGQRHYFDSAPTNCAGLGTIILTGITGPLNYLGLNPKVTDCTLPQPSP